jgi:probable blue pigment (indigoidine) exporter
MLLSSLGYVLAKRWGTGVDVLASTCWQLLAGGLLLLPFAAAFEGAPPALDGRALLGFGYVAVIATAVAFTAWFAALSRLPAATVGLVGLLNPVTGVLLGTAVAHEPLSVRQFAGLPLVLAGVLLGRPAPASGSAAPGGGTGSARMPGGFRRRRPLSGAGRCSRRGG